MQLISGMQWNDHKIVIIQQMKSLIFKIFGVWIANAVLYDTISHMI